MKKDVLEKLDKLNRTMTIYDVMKHAGVSRQTIYSWMDKGLQRSKTELGELRFSLAEVDQFLAEKRNERRILELKPRKAVNIDAKLFQKLIDRAPGKQHIEVIDDVVEAGLKIFDAEKMKDLGRADKMVRIEKELFKKLLYLSVEWEKPVYKIANNVISLGLDSLSSAG